MAYVYTFARNEVIIIIKLQCCWSKYILWPTVCVSVMFFITGSYLLSSHVQYQSAISAGGSYFGYSASFSVNIAQLSQRESFTSQFASSLYTIASGLQIEERNGHYYASNPQTRAPVLIKFSLITIDAALDSRLWTQLPESGTSYRSLKIDQKKRSLQTALRAYPALTNAQRASGIPMHVTCNNVSQ